MTNLDIELNTTVSRATLNPAHLIPTFLDVLKDTPEYTQIVIPAYVMEDDQADYWYSDEAAYLLEELFYTLESYAPDGYYFGCTEGDASDFGFWEVEEEF